MSKARNIANGIGGGSGNVTDAEKAVWNAKQAALVSGQNIKTINGVSLLGSENITIAGGTGGGTASSVAWADVTGKPSTFTPAAHNHTISDVTGLGAALAAASGGSTPYYTATATSGNTFNLNYTNGLHQKLTISGTSTASVSIAGWPAAGTSAIMMLDIVNGGSVAAFAFPGTTVWVLPSGATGTLAATGMSLQTSGTDTVLLWSTNGGTNFTAKLLR